MNNIVVRVEKSNRFTLTPRKYTSKLQLPLVRKLSITIRLGTKSQQVGKTYCAVPMSSMKQLQASCSNFG